MSFKGGPGGDIGDIEIKTTNTGSLAQLAIAETVSPPAPADGAGGILYTKADGKPYWISNEVSETDLSSGGGGGISHDGSTANGILTFKDADEATVESKALVDGAKITIGNGTAEDTLLVFDGNTADFRIGIDDDSDTLEIGAGAVHDTTAAVVVDASGHVVKIGQDSPTNGQFLKWDGSKAVWDDAGGTSKQTWAVQAAGRFYIASTTNLITHTGTPTNIYGDWGTQRSDIGSRTNTSFTSTSFDALYYYSIGVAPFACTVKNVSLTFQVGNGNGDYPSDPPEFRVWKGTYTNDSTGVVTWSQLTSSTKFPSADVGEIQNKNLTTFDTGSFAQGDLLGFTFEGDQTVGSSGYNSFIFSLTAIED